MVKDHREQPTQDHQVLRVLHSKVVVVTKDRQVRQGTTDLKVLKVPKVRRVSKDVRVSKVILVVRPKDL